MPLVMLSLSAKLVLDGSGWTRQAKRCLRRHPQLARLDTDRESPAKELSTI